MKKIAIQFALDEEDNLNSLAQHLQRFIIEDDYRIYAPLALGRLINKPHR
jgi:hypothetical protein